jgi:hypothetical protein
MEHEVSGHHYNGYGTEQEREAISLINAIKDTYAKKVDELNELKRQFFTLGPDAPLDHQQRSRLRIMIESLLIDLNEEIFSLSEELARSYSGAYESGSVSMSRARQFEERMLGIMRRAREDIDDN